MCCSHHFLRIFYAVALLFIGQTAIGQILVGPKIGTQYGWVSMDNDADRHFVSSSPSIGFHAGGAAIFRVRERFYLHTELLYTFRQQVITGNLDESLKSRTNNNYLELPVTFKMNFSSRIKNLNYQWFAGAGPNISYWMWGNTKLESSELIEQYRSPTNYSLKFSSLPDSNADPETLYIEDPNRIQLGINAVIGLMFEPQEGKAFIIDFRFDYGHSFIARKDYGYYPGLLDYSEPTRARYHAFKIGFAYVFDTKVSERNKGRSNYQKKGK